MPRRNNRSLCISQEVESALEADQPVVAFETTILTFGLPQPLNREVAARCEAIARAEGATPATLAILDGEMRVGLDPEEVAFFCSRDSDIRKVNLQNLSAVLHARKPGALTVAACLQVCSLAGLQLFATGGIGGVHRQFQHQPDISADLVALSRFPVATVCAGAKSILDVPATLEALETLGVPVIGFGTDTLPLFHARESGHKLDTWFEDVSALAEFLHVHFQVARGGVLVVAPVPEAHAIDHTELEGWISEALAAAAAEGVSGKKVTPFLLERLEGLSDGRTLQANRALVENNAGIAARIAKAMK